jgi:hypothetical protein
LSAEEVQQETCHIIKQSKPQKRNTSKAEREALWAQRENKDMFILPADKDNATAVMNSKDYIKMGGLLSIQTYRLLTTGLTKAVGRKLTRLIKKSEIAEKVAKTLIPNDITPPRCYG